MTTGWSPLGLPIHTGYFIGDLRTCDLEWWENRKCKAAFMQLMGQEGVTGAWIQEVAPGESTPPVRFALDEVVYVVEGRGTTTVWRDDNGTKKTFEWHNNSMFIVPRNYHYTINNMQGDKVVRLLHYNYLPLAMSSVGDPDFFFDNPFSGQDVIAVRGRRVLLRGQDGHGLYQVERVEPARLLVRQLLP